MTRVTTTSNYHEEQIKQVFSVSALEVSLVSQQSL